MGIDEGIARARRATVGDFDPYVNMAKTGAFPAGRFRVAWLRRLLVVLWWIAAGLTGLMLLFDLGFLVLGHSFRVDPFNPLSLLLLGFASSLGLTGLIFDLWVIGGLGYLARVWRMRNEGARARVPIWKIVLSVALILGRPSSFLLLFLFSLIPNHWWLLWPLKFGVLPPLVLIVAGMINMFAVYMSFTLFVLTVILLPIKIFQSVFQISNALFLVNAQRTMFLGELVFFWYWFTGTPLPQGEAMPDDSKGARFAVPREIEAMRTGGPVHMAFGYVGDAPLYLKNEKHVLIMASTRSGKGVSLIIPHLLRYPGSAFVLDPKGENARATGRRRAALNSKVFYLDPFGISGMPKARFNPLSRFTPENMEAESKALAAALVMGERGMRDHWTGSAQQLLAGVILHVVTSPDIPPEKKDLGTVRRLLLRDMNRVLKQMLASEAADGLLSRLAASFVQTPEKEFGSILSTAQRETEILDNPFIVASLAASGPGEAVDFAAWHNATMSVFLCLSAPKFPVFNRWLRLVLTSALDEMTDSLDPPELPVCFMLDELATLGHLQPVENAVGLAAGYGIQLVTVFQDVAQMKDLYKGRWASFIGNAGVRAVFALDDYETANYWSQFMGRNLVETMSQQQDVYGMTKGQSKGEAMRPLRAPEELMMEFARDRMLVLPQGARPIVSERVPYFDDPRLKKLWDDPRRKGAEAKARQDEEPEELVDVVRDVVPPPPKERAVHKIAGMEEAVPYVESLGLRIKRPTRAELSEPIVTVIYPDEGKEYDFVTEKSFMAWVRQVYDSHASKKTG